MLVLGLTGMPGSGKNELLKILKSLEFKINLIKPKDLVEQQMKDQTLLESVTPQIFLDFDSIDMGRQVKKKMEEEKIALTSENVRAYATRLREVHGLDVVAKLCVPAIDSALDKGKLVIIEDIKGWQEAKFFREKYGEKFVLVAIHTPPKIRFERAKNREAEWDSKKMETLEKFNWRDEKELGWGLGNAIAMADYVLVNDGTLADFKDEAEKLFRKILS